jgi:hypothetical protein
MDAPAPMLAKRMAQGVKPHSFEPGGLADSGPRLFQIGLRLSGLFARDNVRGTLDAGQSGKHFESRCWEIDRLFARLAVRQEDHAALNIDVRPLSVEDFAKAGSG